MKHGVFRRWQAAAFAVCLAALLACWVIPVRLATDPGHGWYTFGYSSDEYAYSQRIDVLPVGASANNVFNKFSDSDVISPYFMDRLFRGFLTITGMDVVTFFWTWRFLFPIGLLGISVAISRVCLREHPWSWPLALCSGSAALLAMFLYHHAVVDRLTVYFIDMDYVPIFMMLNRLPANIEFLLGGFFVVSLLWWSRNPSSGIGAILSLAVAAAFYLRPYLGLPCAIALVLAVVWSLAIRNVALRDCMIPALLLIVAMAPWLYILRHNNSIPAHIEQMTRMFLHPFPYMVHPLWPLYVFVGAGLLAAIPWMAKWARVSIASSAISLCGLPFYAGATPVAREMLSNDRFSCFYLPLLLAAVMLLISQRMQSWRGAKLAFRFHRALSVTSVICACAGAAVFYLSLRFEFEAPFHPAFVQRDQRYFKAYEWVLLNTPDDALFLVDDGFDRSKGLASERDNIMAMTRLGFFHFDFFSAITHRQRVYADLSYVYYMSEADLNQMTALQWGSFGYPLKGVEYAAALKRLQPGYVFWRKSPPIFQPDAVLPVPRGQYGTRLQQFSTTVYRDEHCEIWQMNYTNKMPNKNDSGPAAK
jgi:hypothetical protein